jgi:hypothetical protein
LLQLLVLLPVVVVLADAYQVSSGVTDGDVLVQRRPANHVARAASSNHATEAEIMEADGTEPKTRNAAGLARSETD